MPKSMCPTVPNSTLMYGQGFTEHADIILSEPERVVIAAKLDSDGYMF